MKNETVPVPVEDDGMMKSIAQLFGGQTSTAENIDELTKDFGAVEDQMGYQVESGPASAGWLRIAVALQRHRRVARSFDQSQTAGLRTQSGNRRLSRAAASNAAIRANAPSRIHPALASAGTVGSR